MTLLSRELLYYILPLINLYFILFTDAFFNINMVFYLLGILFIMKVLYSKSNIRGNGVYRIISSTSYSNYNIEDRIMIDK